MLSWTPYAIVALMGMMSNHSSMAVTPLLSEIPVMFAKTSAAYNPMIYAISHPKFRTEIDKSFPWLLACCRPAPTSSRDASQTNQSVTMATRVEKEVESEGTTNMTEAA